MKSHGSISEKGKMERLEMEEGDPSTRKIAYPKGVFFIMATELSERFSYYGMRAVLTIYMRNELSFTEDQATSYYHIFLMVCYGLPIFWGVVSDSWLGKFKTILFVSILFAIGNVTLALSSVPPLHLPTKTFFFIGLFLMALATSGMKPCVAPLGGEQFVLPQQTKQLTQFFSWFFFAVTIGNMISTVITPIFRRDVSCFGMQNCFPLAFGVPAGTMILAVVIFTSGRSLYKVNKPNGNILVKVTKCVVHAISNRRKKTADTTIRQHWLDSASDLYEKEIIEDTKGLIRVLPLFLPVPMFFALYEQLGSRWTLQATRMKGTLGSFSIKPDQMQVSNAILMFVSLPLFNLIYSLLAKTGVNLRPLQKMVIGGLLAAMSFGVAGIVEMKIEPAIRSSPAAGNTVVTLVNSIECPVSVWTNSTTSSAQNYTIQQNDFLTLPQFAFKNPATFIVRTASRKCPASSEWIGYDVNMHSDKYQSISISTLSTDKSSMSVTAYPFTDDYVKSKDGNARIRFIIEQEKEKLVKTDSESLNIILSPVNGGLTKTIKLLQNNNLFYSETEEVDENEYNVILDATSGTLDVKNSVELLNGGSYNLIIYRNSTTTSAEQVHSQLVVITPPNNVHILWLLPQYILMAWGEILFIVSGMEFAYTEAPASMKSVVQAIWHLMNACGNVIVIIAAQNHGGQGSQAIEFFVFGALMLVDSIIYFFMARRYKYVAQDSKAIVMH